MWLGSRRSRHQLHQLYGAGEHAATVFKENFGKVLEQNVKGLSELNSNYKNFFDVKRAANKIFKPYAGKYGTKTGEQFLKRAGLPKTKGTVSDVFLSDLEREMGTNFSGQSKGIGESLSTIRETGKQQARSIGEAMQQRLIELEAKKNKLGRGDIPERLIGLARKIGRYGSGRIL